MSNSIGTARVDIVMDTQQYELAIARAKNAAVGFGADAEAAFNKQSHSSRSAAKSLLNYVSYLGKTRDEVRLLRAAGAGVDKAIIDAAAKSMGEYAEATASAAAEAARLATSLAKEAEINKLAAALERQIATYGMSASEMRRMEAATTDLSGRLTGLVDVLERVEASAAHDNAVEQMTASLRRQIETLGMGAAELRAYQASMAGVSNEVQPLLLTLERLESSLAFQGKLDASTAALEKQIATFGMSESELRRYELAAQGVSAEVDHLVTALEKMEAKARHDGAVEQMTASLRRQIETLGMNSAELRAYEASLAGVSNEVQPLLLRLEQLEAAMAFQDKLDSATASLEKQIATFGMGDAELRRYQLGLDGVLDSVEPLVQKLERLEAEAKQAQQAMNDNAQVNSFLSGLESQAEAIGKTNSELMAMKAAKLGVSQQAAPFIQMLKQEEDRMLALRGAMASGGKELNEYGLSQKQLAFAMRGVPAQITDIFVSLQGGQNPLTVALQQGGQLKDMFGGIKPAAAALAGELWKLVNVYSVVAAAVGVAAVAWYNSTTEQEKHHKALIMTGYYSAQTSDQLNEMAMRLDETAGVTRRAAAGVLDEMAKVGTFTSEQMELAARAALQMSNVMGVEIEKTRSKFVELGKDPVKALLDLNRAEHFLTEAQLARVNALIEEGKNQEAVTEAFKIYAGTIDDRTGQVIEHINGISRAWVNLKNAMGEGWDGLTDAMSKVDAQFGSIADRIAKMGTAGQTASLLGIGLGASPAAALITRLAGQREAPFPQNLDRGETVDSEAYSRQQENQKKWEQLTSRYLSDLERQTKEEQEIRELGAKMKLDSVKIEEQVEAMREKYRKKGTRGAEREDRDSLRAALQAYKDQAETTTALVQANARVTQQAFQTQQISAEEYYNAMRQYAQQELDANTASIQGQLGVLAASKQTANARRQMGELEAELAKLRSKNAADLQVLNMQEAENTRKLTMEILRYGETLDNSNQVFAENLALQQAAVGMGSVEAQRVAEITRLYMEQADKLFQLNMLRRENPGKADIYDQQEAEIRQFTATRVKMTEEGFAAMDALTSNWTNGYRRALSNYLAEMRDVATNAEGFINGVAGNIEGIIADLAINGKASTTDLVNFMIKELTRLGTQKMLGWLMSMWNPGAGAQAVQREAIPLTFNAKGNVYESPDLSKYSGQVHDTPQFFKFAKGGGVFGEAGPEAIMPLKRTSNGKLGVVAQGGGAPQVTVNLIGAPAGTSVQERQEQDGSLTLDVIFGQVEGYLASNVSNGTGPLNTAVRARYGLKESV